MKGFRLRASGLELISSMRLDGRKGIQSVRSAWSILHSELIAGDLPPLKQSNKGCKTSTFNFLFTLLLKFLQNLIKQEETSKGCIAPRF